MTKYGCLFIDGVDVYERYGVYVIDGGWDGLIAFPPLKTVPSNDWQEEDGLECDLSAPVLNTRDVTLKFAVKGEVGNLHGFLTLLSDKAVHEFRCEEVGRTFRLRLVSQSSLDYYSLLGFLSLKFADDYPLDGYTYEAPTGGGIAPQTGYRLDGVPFSDYGVVLLQGSVSEIARVPSVKTALLRNITTQPGAEYDGDGPVTYKSADVKLTCLLRAGGLAEMWCNWYALLHDLTQPGERRLYCRPLQREYPCHYKSCSVSDFSATGRVWLQFSLTLTVICSPLDVPDILRTVNGEAALRFTSSGEFRFI